MQANASSEAKAHAHHQILIVGGDAATHLRGRCRRHHGGSDAQAPRPRSGHRHRRSGGTALFTQPAMPIKCAGAPQKILYLVADHFRKTGLSGQSKVKFHLTGDAMFGVSYFVPILEKTTNDYGIQVNFKSTLRAIDGPAKTAIFSVTDASGAAREMVRKFDIIHVTPPQSAPDFIKRSLLANEAGWVSVDQGTLQHPMYPNVFGLGDACSTPNAKTAAAVRKQAPVVVNNLLALMAAKQLDSKYDGYGSCPLTTAYGKVVLAEFAYGGKVTPSFNFDPQLPRTSM